VLLESGVVLLESGVVLLESGVEWLAKLTVEAQSVLLENAVDLGDWGPGSRSGVKEQVKVEAEWE